jgi:hypothetical protein
MTFVTAAGVRVVQLADGAAAVGSPLVPGPVPLPLLA